MGDSRGCPRPHGRDGCRLRGRRPAVAAHQPAGTRQARPARREPGPAAHPVIQPEAIVAALLERGLTVATAESLTGGLVCAALTSVPGSSETVRGGVVSYASDLKADLLGVDPDRLAQVGAV